MTRTNYAERLRIPLSGCSDMPFYTKEGVLLARGYERIVIGDRGPYIEFTDQQLVKEHIHIPESQKWRVSSLLPFYNEWRSLDLSVKIYQQRKTVDYADYRIGYWYASPFEIRTDEFAELVQPR